jgi:hypothetical protein
LFVYTSTGVVCAHISPTIMSPIARLPARDLSNTDLLDGGGEGVYIETKQKTGTRNAGKGNGPNFSSVILFASLALWKPLKKIPNLQLCGHGTRETLV